MPAGPPDPITNLEEMAAQLAEMFRAYCKAGIPPSAAAVILGTWMGTIGSQAQEGGDGT